MNAYLSGLLLSLIVICTSSSINSAYAYGGDDPNPPVCDYSWVLQNKCSEQLRVAINYQNCDNRWVTEGWWVVQPQSEIMIRVNSLYIGYLAISQSKKFWWYDSQGPEFGVDLKKHYFIYPNDGKRDGVDVLKFKWINVMDHHITSLGCQ